MVRIKNGSMSHLVPGSLFSFIAAGATSAIITIVSITWNMFSIISTFIIAMLAISIIGIGGLVAIISTIQEYILCLFNIGYLGATPHYLSGYDLNKYETKASVYDATNPSVHSPEIRKATPLVTQKN